MLLGRRLVWVRAGADAGARSGSHDVAALPVGFIWDSGRARRSRKEDRRLHSYALASACWPARRRWRQWLERGHSLTNDSWTGYRRGCRRPARHRRAAALPTLQQVLARRVFITAPGFDDRGVGAQRATARRGEPVQKQSRSGAGAAGHAVRSPERPERARSRARGNALLVQAWINKEQLCARHLDQDGRPPRSVVLEKLRVAYASRYYDRALGGEANKAPSSARKETISAAGLTNLEKS